MSAEQPSNLLLIGVGGGGCRLVASVKNRYSDHLRTLGIDTDALSNREAVQAGVPCVLLGGARLAGNGTGGDPVKGRLTFQDDMHVIMPHLQGVRTAVLLTCLGAGTGSGVTPEMCRMLHDQGIATLCVVTLPFMFEGDARRKVGERTLPMIEEHADALMVVELDELFSEASQALLKDAIASADDILSKGVTLIWRLLNRPGFIHIDPERLHTMIMRGGNVRFGAEAATGEDRARVLTAKLKENRLLKSSEAFGKANAVLVGLLAGSDLRLMEIGQVMGDLRGFCRGDAEFEIGTVLDPEFDGRMELVVLTFENWVMPVAAVPSAGQKKDAASAQDAPPIDVFQIQPGNAKRAKNKSASKLSFGTTGRGKFQKVEATLYNGQDLDVPTFQRRNIRLER